MYISFRTFVQTKSIKWWACLPSSYKAKSQQYCGPPLNVAQQMKIKNKLFQIAQNVEEVCKTYFFVTPQLQQQLIQPLSSSM